MKRELGYRDQVSFDQGMRETLAWYAANPLPPGGEIEANVGDPFDYEYEDHVIDAFLAQREQFEKQISSLEARKVVWRHPYPHPKKRGDLR